MFKDKPDLEFRREREVSQRDIPSDGKPEPEITGAAASEDDHDKLLKDMEGVIDKAGRLHAAAATTATNLPIPVSEDAPDVRAAVARIDASSDGSLISYELYQAAKDRANRRLSQDEVLEFGSKMTGISTIDARRIKDASGGKADGEDLMKLGFVGHFALLLLANKLMAGMTAGEANKQTGAQGLPGLAASWGITLSTMVAMHVAEGKSPKEIADLMAGEMRDDTLSALKTEGLTVEQMLENADSEAQSIRPTSSMLHERMGGADWHVTENFADEFLVNTDTPGYNDWMIAEDAREADRNMAESLEEAKRYGEVVGGLAKLPNEVFKMFRCETDGTNTNLDMAAAALYTKYAADLVCCYVMWLGKAIDLKNLKMLRTLLGLLLKGVNLDIGSLMKRMGTSIRDRLKKMLMKPLFHMLRKFFSKIAKPITDWLTTDNKKWKLVFACTPIDEMFRYILKALKALEKMLMHFLMKLWDGIQLKNINWRAKTGSLADKNKLTQSLKILNGVIKAVERGNLCADDNADYPSDAEIRRLARQLLGELPDYPDLTLGHTGDPFRDFNPVEFDTPLGIRIAPAAEAVGQKRTIEEVSPADCLKRLTDENIIPLVASLEVDQDVERIKNLFDG
jgi:hypothetical protein